MRWTDQRQSDNIEDRRGPGRTIAVGGGLGGVLLLLLALIFGADPRQILEQLPQSSDNQQTSRSINPEDEQQKQFVAVVLAQTEDAWGEKFRAAGREYRKPTLVLFTDRVNSGCGVAGSATGPFYCPRDQKLYMDLSFFRELRTRFGAPGDFAAAYVVAHEVGHHVQNLLGIMDRVEAQRGRDEGAEGASVRLELQADFLAGVWANYVQRRGLLDPGDVEEALRAASAVGDDRLQRQSQGYVVPDSFTHGTSEQRSRWFRKGLETGDMRQGDTFSASQL